jgi:ALG6, ALG8 glycosyltransferase family
LLPIDGLRFDIDEFVSWVHRIAIDGVGNVYDDDVTFGPVMAYIWGMLAAIEPAFRLVTDATDPGIRALMRTPASLADIGLALLATYALRDRPRWAIIAAVVIVVHPAVFHISGWWGQYESIYLLSALAAVVLAVNGHDKPAAMFVAVSLMTKPQALPFVLPFAAWFWARGGLRGLVIAGAVGLATIALLWLPFLAADGPRNYLQNLAKYQQEIFPIMSLRAWNLWWIVQDWLAPGEFVHDQTALIGPLTARYLGYGITFGLSLLIAIRIVREPTPRSLILGLAAASMVSFCFLTGMHERYAYGAVIFLMLLVPERPIRWLALALGVAFILNLLAALPPEGWPVVPIGGLVGFTGSLAMLAIMVATLVLLMRQSEAPGQDHRVGAMPETAGL